MSFTNQHTSDPPILHLPKLLDIIIPTYKRPEAVVVAATSVLSQLKQYNLEDKINLTIWDDCSPDLNIDQISSPLSQYEGLYRIGQNNINKGMGRNIFDLVSAAKSEFCTILTDDDWFEPDSLPEILDEIKAFRSCSPSEHTATIGAFFVPRYSYLDDGSLHCVECKPFDHDSIIIPSSINVIRYCRISFILTGLFFRPSLVNYKLWQENQGNAFFPLIYYSSIATKFNIKYINRKWVHHTCLNPCHWESWGRSAHLQDARLLHDYLQALIIIAHTYPPIKFIDRYLHAKYLHCAIDAQLSSFRAPAQMQFEIVCALSRKSIVLLGSYMLFLLRSFFALIRTYLLIVRNSLRALAQS